MAIRNNTMWISTPKTTTKATPTPKTGVSTNPPKNSPKATPAPKTEAPLTGDAAIRRDIQFRIQQSEAQKKAEEAKIRAEEAKRIRGDVVADVEYGTSYGKEIVGDKSLGRITEGATENALVQEGRLNALKGFDAPELSALRGQAVSQIDSASEGALRRLQGGLAASGVRGATASAAQGEVLNQNIEQKRQLEQGLLIENRSAQQAALDKLQENVVDDLNRQSSEKFAQLSTGLGFAQIGSAERAGLAAKEAQIKAANASGGGGGK